MIDKVLDTARAVWLTHCYYNMNKDTTQPSEQCSINQFSSRMCERGTKCCETRHTKPSEHAIAAMEISFPYSKEYAENNPHSETADWFAGMAAQFDKHAIAPAVAEAAKATGEDTELLNWLEESNADLTYSLRDKWSVVSEHGVVSMYETPRAAINAARAQQKDTP